MTKRTTIRVLPLLGMLWLLASAGQVFPQETAGETLQLSRTPCTRPAFLHCPDQDCAGDRVINPGPEVEMNSRRTYFLDYPCDLKPGEEVTFVLSLHGGGSYAN